MTQAMMRVLVVDDEFLVGLLAAEALEGLGHEALVVGSAEHAIEVAREEAFDLLLTDLGLPGMGGDALIERLRRARPGLPVLVSTGHALGEAERAGLAKGGPPVGLLEKPWCEGRLRDALRSVTSWSARLDRGASGRG
jgi:CheY-like chemotaxis protein